MFAYVWPSFNFLTLLSVFIALNEIDDTTQLNPNGTVARAISANLNLSCMQYKNLCHSLYNITILMWSL